MKKITSTALAVSALACMISYPVFAADEALPVKVSEPKTKTSEVPGTLGAKNQSIKTNYEPGQNSLQPRPSTGIYDRLQFAEANKYTLERNRLLPDYAKVKVTRSNRLMVMPNGQVKFTTSAGTLQSNIQTLLMHTNGGTSYFPADFPASIRLFNEYTMTGDNVIHLIDQMVEPWSQSHRLTYKTYINNVIQFNIK